jgi:transposase
VVSKIPASEKRLSIEWKAGDSQALLALIADLRKKVAAKLGVETAVVSCFEAERDGFWLHRLLSEHGVINHVAEPKRTPTASIVSENISSRKGFASRTGLLTF